MSLKTTLLVSSLLLITLAFWGWLNQNKLSVWLYFARFHLERDEALKCGALLRILHVPQEANLDLDSLIQRTHPDGRFKLERSVVLPLPGNYAMAELQETLEWAKRQKSGEGSFAHWLLLQKKPNGEYEIIHTCRKYLG